MIPESEGCSATRPTVKSAPDAAASGPKRAAYARTPSLGWENQQQTDNSQFGNSAWTRYRYFVEAMHSQGHYAFNRKLVLEAMFRGGDLVYSGRSPSPCPS